MGLRHPWASVLKSTHFKDLHFLILSLSLFPSLSRFWIVSLRGPRRPPVWLQGQRPGSFLWEQHHVQMWARIHSARSYHTEVYDGGEESLGQPPAFLYRYVSRCLSLKSLKIYSSEFCLCLIPLLFTGIASVCTNICWIACFLPVFIRTFIYILHYI